MVTEIDVMRVFVELRTRKSKVVNIRKLFYMCMLLFDDLEEINFKVTDFVANYCVSCGRNNIRLNSKGKKLMYKLGRSKELGIYIRPTVKRLILPSLMLYLYVKKPESYKYIKDDLIISEGYLKGLVAKKLVDLSEEEVADLLFRVRSKRSVQRKFIEKYNYIEKLKAMVKDYNKDLMRKVVLRVLRGKRPDSIRKMAEDLGEDYKKVYDYVNMLRYLDVLTVIKIITEVFVN